MRLKAWTLDQVEDVERVAKAINSLGLVGEPLWLRIVFDLENGPEYYSEPIDFLKSHCNVKIMGQILDSSDFKAVSLGRFRRRIKSYLNVLHPMIDLVECGNEVNGDWLGTSRTVKNKVEAAFDECKFRKLKTAITWYITPKLGDLTRWMDRYPLPAPDYAFLSWYPYTEGTPDWRSLFTAFRQRVPEAYVGIGEYGVEGIGKLSPVKLLEAKVALVRTVESLPAMFPDTVGFGGYWDAVQDVVYGGLLPTFKEIWT